MKIKPFNQRHEVATVLQKEFDAAVPGKMFKITKYTWALYTGLTPRQFLRVHYGTEYELQIESDTHYIFLRKVQPTINIRIYPEEFVFIKSDKEIMKFRVDRIDKGSNKVYLVNDFNPLQRVIYRSMVAPPVFNDGQPIKLTRAYHNQRWYMYKFSQDVERTYQMYMLSKLWKDEYKRLKKELEIAEKLLTHRQRFTKCFKIIDLFKEFGDRIYAIRKTSPIPEFVSSGKRKESPGKRRPPVAIEANPVGGTDI